MRNENNHNIGIGEEEVEKALQEIMRTPGYKEMLSDPRMNDYDENGVPYWEKWEKLPEVPQNIINANPHEWEEFVNGWRRRTNAD